MERKKVYNWMQSYGGWSVVAFTLILAGCASGPEPITPAEAAATAPRYYTPVPAAEGSLWSDRGAMLFVDTRARGVGDTVIVDIVENTSSKMAANTKTERTSVLDANVDGLTGGKHINENLGDNQLFLSEFVNDYEGKASSDRSGRITASIGAQVTDVLPNGNLVIYGRREMKVNNENQYIMVSGIARPNDIQADNHITSIYLADARLEYSGQGVLADKQRPGWGARLMDYVWPF